MKYLADTHIMIWAIKNDPKLSQKARELLLDNENVIYYSFVNVWEIAIKHALHKSEMSFSAQFLKDYVEWQDIYHWKQSFVMLI